MMKNNKEHQDYLQYLKEIGYQFPMSTTNRYKNKNRGNGTPIKNKAWCRIKA